MRWLWEIVSAVLLFVLTYPMIEPDYGCGLDSSYVWGFNWLFDHDYDTLTRLIYPFGPFLWLKIPILEGCHFVVFLVFFFLAKVFFIWQGLVIARHNGCNLFVAVLAMIPGCVYGNIDVYLVFNVAFLVYWYIDKRQWYWFAIASVIAIFSLTIKMSIGVQSCGILFVGWTIGTIAHKDIKQSGIAVVSILLSALVIGLSVYQSWSGMLLAYEGIPRLVLGYSDALVLMPEHRLWALAIFGVATLLLVIVQRDNRSRWLCFLLLIPLYANWKHGIVREDFWHFKQLIAFAACFLMIVPSCMASRRWVGFGLGVLGLTMLFVNINSLRLSPEWQITSVKPGNLVQLVVKHKEYNENWERNIAETLSNRKLDSNIVSQIGTSTVDCYPWEAIYIASNGFRWQPSVAVQFGAGNTQWVNHLAAKNFGTDSSAVDYLILHRVNYDKEDGLQSLDGRYMLNDEPEVLDSILTNYTVADTGWYGLLLKKERIGKLSANCDVANVKTTWDEWIDVPRINNAVLRADIKVGNSWKGLVRGILYKPDICYVDYKLSDGRELTYRFSPSSAQGGIWVGPFAETYGELSQVFMSNSTKNLPQAIRLRAKHSGWHQKNINVKFRKVMVINCM